MADDGSGFTLRTPAGPAPAGTRPRPAGPRRSDILAALSLAIDLGLGQPLEHMLRATVLGLRLAAALGLDGEQRGRVYYANQIAWIGCHADSPELAALFGDDLSFRADYYLVDARGLPMVSLMLRHTATTLPPVRRALAQTRFAATGRSSVRELISSHCTSAGHLATRVGLDDSMPHILGSTFERWDGKGLPNGISGVEIPLEMRIAHVADTAEIFLRTAGTEAAVAMVAQRRGTQFDPALADLFCARAGEFAAGLLELDPWTAALAGAPAEPPLEEAELDGVLTALGDFADLKSPWTAGHSRAVAELAAAAAADCGCAPAEAAVLRRAGWVHDLGRMGVSNSVWDKTGPLSSVDREHLQMYPFLTGRILARVPGLQRVAEVAAAHRERLDGSGYPRGLPAAGLDPLQRMLAAADFYQSSLEPRPHRPAMAPREAGARLLSEVRAGRLDPAAVDAVLAAAGQPQVRRRPLPSSLSPRELEVLRLLCRGLDNRAIARQLVISPKTARNHVEHIYVKTGCSNRVTATLYALDKGLWELH